LRILSKLVFIAVIGPLLLADLGTKLTQNEIRMKFLVTSRRLYGGEFIVAAKGCLCPNEGRSDP